MATHRREALARRRRSLIDYRRLLAKYERAVGIMTDPQARLEFELSASAIDPVLDRSLYDELKSLARLLELSSPPAGQLDSAAHDEHEARPGMSQPGRVSA